MNISKNKKQDIIDDVCGIKVSDPYRWLENYADPEVKGWVIDQNSRTKSALEDDIFRVFSDELAKNFKVTNFSNPIPVNGRYFYTERKPDENQPVLYVKNGLDGTPTVLFDPNGKRNGNTLSIDYWDESKMGKYMVYGVSEGGDEMATLYIKDVDTGEELPEKIVHCRYSSVAWLSDEKSFVYTRNARPGTVPKEEEPLHQKVYLHKLGDNPDNDLLIFGAGRPKDDMISISISPDDRYVAMRISKSWTENEIHIYDMKTGEIKPLIIGIKSNFSLVFLEEKMLITTDYKANNYRILQADYVGMYKPIDEWSELIPEREYSLESLRVTKDKIFVEYLVNASSEVIEFDRSGKETGKIPLPKYSGLAGMSTRKKEEEFFYGVDSFIFPKITYRFDPKTKQYSEYRKTENPINPEDYEVKQEWAVSKDGTKIPVFIFHKKGLELNGKNPTLLYGYGGFGKSQGPAFMRNWVPWVERGGVFAIANIRGGGEFGEKWHKDGIRGKKQNSFDDFIASAELLISRKYTSPAHLGIIGGSNGGLLVSAVGVQRPDLFGAVCSRVPLTDMVRFSKFGIAARWVDEYGNPEVKDDLINILKWSPYHNVKPGVKYPSSFYSTGDRDTRVEPLHSRKMTAMLQDMDPESKVYLFTDIDAGHGAGKPISKIVENQALTLSFFAKELGLKV